MKMNYYLDAKYNDWITGHIIADWLLAPMTQIIHLSIIQIPPAFFFKKSCTPFESIRIVLFCQIIIGSQKEDKLF